MLLTFGSGLGKLEDLRRFRRERAPWSGVFAPLGLLFWVIALFSLGWIGSGGLIDPDFGDAAFTLFLGLLSFLVAVGVVTGIQPDREKLAPEARFGIALRWCDHWTSSDPVPNGPLFDPGKAPEYLNSREEANHGSFFRDHTAYHRNVEGFAASLAAELARLRGLHLVLRPGDGARLRLGRQRRRFRVRCSVLARRVALVALVAVPWALGAVGRLRPIGRGLCDRLGALAARSPEWIAGLIEPLLDLDAAVHGIAVTWAGVGLAYAPVAVAWHAWSWWDVQDYFRRREYRIGAWPWVWAILAAAFASVLLALASLPFMPQVAAEGESMTLPWIYPMATVLLAFGVELVRGLVGCLVRCVCTLSRWRAIFAGKLVPRVVLAFVGNLFDVYLGACGRALWIGPLTFLWTYPPVVVLWRWLGGAGEEREPWIVGGSLAIALLGVVVTILAERRLYRRVEALAGVGDPARALKEETRSLLEVLRPPDPPGSAEPAG